MRAAAASQAAAILLLTGSAPAEIRLLTPGGVTFNLPVEQASLHDGEAVCTVRKDAGDDPDITNGVLISSAVRRADSGIVIDGGSGVGRVTRPGLAGAGRRSRHQSRPACADQGGARACGTGKWL
ncbi:MAG: cobalt-precorrin-5B (C(1))-methyltransferase [Butyricicoccaceae bacterium]